MKPELLQIGGVTPRMSEQMSKHFNVHELNAVPNVNAFLKEKGGLIQAVITNGHDGVKPEIMSALPNLKMISGYGVGYDAIDVNAAAERGIVVSNTPGVLSADVANTAIMLMLAVSRRLIRDDHWVRSGKWKASGAAPLTRSIEGASVGILGLGRIGQAIAHKLEAFDCKISYNARTKKDSVPYLYVKDLVEMARNVDYLVIITPGGSSTNKLVNREVMDALGPEGTLINVARGSVVDEAALVLALQEGRLGNAGLDVFEEEPNAPEALFAMDNVVLLPHVASATVETRQAMGDLTVENAVKFFNEGKALTPVPECAHL